ncbi:hypothetical protein QP933_06700 [Corynebacterium pseudodiphtheriticum]|uniref:hypothetical protein n=1 Tax=Corynebacterium pseudodiphtheriticum TaxID=37637 RepID=UPI00254A08EC|nr:hypothetical protein [Corynebacterium pseudodiphtheriticum]MDK8500627.1 hypothetical protein [Corynebacterium pseudodiphtheriticum]MDK8775814.1 hypothetical protein [Corynebacterium pseudodiphtheriticum]
MRPGLFKVLRTSLGLSAQDVATANGVALRTAQRWETNRVAHGDAQEWIWGKWRRMEELVSELVESADSDGVVELDYFRDDRPCFERAGLSASEYHAMLGHAIAAIRGAGLDYVIREY